MLIKEKLLKQNNFIINLKWAKNEFLFDHKNIFNLYLFDPNGNNSTNSINITLKNQAKLNIYCLIFANNKTKNYFLKINHEGNYNKSLIKTLIFSRNKANVSFNCFASSKNKKNCAQQIINGVVLDNSARITITPSLNIKSNDSIAKHLVNLGQLDQENLFYLNCKGITKKDYYKLLIERFCFENNFLSIFSEQKIIKELNKFNFGNEY